MRNRNIFIRKETAFSVIFGNGRPVFANIVDYVDGNVFYAIDYPEYYKKDVWQWHYADNNQLSGTYVTSLDNFLSRFMPDVLDEYSSYKEG